MKKIVPSRTSLTFTSKISDLELKFFLTLFSIFTSFLGILLIFLLVLSEFKRNIIKFYFPWSSLTMTNLDFLYIKNRIWRRSFNYWIFTQNNRNNNLACLRCLVNYKFFLTAIWLLHGQLWVIIEGTASLTRC